MRGDLTPEFAFDPGVVQLNHASYGCATRRVLDRVAGIRSDIERDPPTSLGAALVEPFEAMADRVGRLLDLPGGQVAFTLNATEAHQTLRRSLVAAHGPMTADLPDDAYESVRTAWAPDVDHGPMTRTRVRVASLVASSTARLAGPADLTAEGLLVVDAAHGPGHLDVRPAALAADALFGTLHKWLPAVRPVGLLWLPEAWTAPLVPAITSLRSTDPTEPGAASLLSWRGTWDPAPVLGLDAALDDWSDWRSDGLVTEAERLADVVSSEMARIGLAELNGVAARAPRLRAFGLPGVGVEQARAHFRSAGIEVWLGPHRGHTVMRIATHVYNDVDDVERVAAAAARLVGQAR